MTQTQRILNHLQKGRSITPLQALRWFGCFRLAARISDIRKEGFEVETKLVKAKNNHYAKYYLP